MAERDGPCRCWTGGTALNHIGSPKAGRSGGDDGHLAKRGAV